MLHNFICFEITKSGRNVTSTAAATQGVCECSWLQVPLFCEMKMLLDGTESED